jgi:hypothetical protein
MTDIEMIEEMAEIALKNTMSYTCAKQIAMNFYEQGYRKIPEGSVVLTEDEVYEFRKDQAEVKFLKNKIIEQARKETAEKYFNAVIEMLKEVKQFETIDIKDLVFLHEKNKEYAKQFGVEVEVEE